VIGGSVVRATMPPIVSEGQQSHPPADPTNFSATELAAAVGGDIVRAGSRPVRGGAVDSRLVQAGEAFFALPGERTDGHRYLGAAIEAGAGALVIRDLAALAGLPAASRDADVTIVAVPDPGRALLAAATAWRDRFHPVVVGVTGSLAKTSTKEQVAAVLGSRWSVLRNTGNQNNEVGLPLTVLRLDAGHAAAVLEMGLYVLGDIAQLCAVARPSIGVVTAVRPVHLARAGSIEAIVAGKRELVEALPRDGTAVLNIDDPLVAAMAPATAARVLTYGLDGPADVTAVRVMSLGAAGMRFRLRLPSGDVEVATPALGRHSVHNALAAAAVAYAVGFDPAAIAAGLSQDARAPHRTTLIETGTWRILDDTYNASPDSMAAALDLLADLPGRHIAVLGEMLELGDDAADAHRRVGARAAERTDRLVVVGAGAVGIAQGALAAGMPVGAIDQVPDRAAALELVLAIGRPTDTILLKASRGGALDELVDPLVRAGGDTPGRQQVSA
jgi:UDP-N-acetylmuramoyl-tripeptide--D-alanyl-D-alanine ligase